MLAAAVGVGLAAVLGVLHAYLTRPFWYDEIWRAHFVSEPASSFWPELTVANTPSALGWFGLTRVAGELLGWHSWSLRLPGYLAVPLLGAAIVLLTRRFTGLVAAVFATCWLCLNVTFLDLATQLKPYSVEALAAVCIVLAWSTGSSPRPSLSPWPAPVTGGFSRARLLRRTAAGLLALTAVPGIFLVLPLATAEVWRGPARRWRLVECLPAVAISVAHTVFFIGHQSSQRRGDYWDRQFIAGRGPVEAVRFIVDQMRAFITGMPPGIDRFDPSLIHATVPGGPVVSVLLAVAVSIAGLTGVLVLARRPDGRLLLTALGGAQVLMLGASAARYWPFGPTRTNLFVVPLIVVVIVVGTRRLVALFVAAVRPRIPAAGPQPAVPAPMAATPTLPTGGTVTKRSRLDVSGVSPTSSASANTISPTAVLPLAGLAMIILLGVPLLGTSLSGSGQLWDHRHRTRGLDRMVDAAIAARQLHRPGDLVVVGGRLARPGWLYAMEASDDPAREPAALPSAGAGRVPARVPRQDTIFFGAAGTSLVGELANRRVPPTRLLVFLFDAERPALAPDLAALPRAGWCAGRGWQFPLTGTLTVFDRCAGAAPRLDRPRRTVVSYRTT
ncbi:hypothetical protein [Frankia casuarinae]|uniref:hypothetical protein n=1 Tax=Frankia casuarinae (strain DSM 45818 / CECT 9043 / HFP020203 / CcI3) TaxID=106370 RepID=UPI00030231A3|nr:hypothetical protein [Frankia casuarinae]